MNKTKNLIDNIDAEDYFTVNWSNITWKCHIFQITDKRFLLNDTKYPLYNWVIKVWNCLPSSVVDSMIVAAFKHRLDKYNHPSSNMASRNTILHIHGLCFVTLSPQAGGSFTYPWVAHLLHPPLGRTTHPRNTKLPRAQFQGTRCPPGTKYPCLRRGGCTCAPTHN